ncbi:MAG: 16S rRNA (uracil(1498)-N(3))-methyltransferase, partial [Methylophilales bacterium 28-44-11]
MLTVQLPESSAVHAGRVLRMAEGDEAILFNGDGNDYACHFVSIKKSSVSAQIISSVHVYNESPLNIILLQGISSGDRMDYTIQKAVELGVQAIYPIATERSVVKLDASRAEKRLEHWLQVVISACEQCGRAFVPKVHAPLSLKAWLSQHPHSTSLRIQLNPTGAQRLAELTKPSQTIELLIGAEGGLNSFEIETATAHGFQSILLGRRILRTETAAVTAIASMQT